MTHETYPWGSRKVTIVGAGAVGSTFAYALMQHGSADEVVLIDRDEDLAKGQAQDLSHGRSFMPPVQVRAGAPDDYADSKVIVVTAGSAQKEGETRLDLLGRNTRIVNSIVDDIAARESEAVIVIVTNPVDVLTYAALEHSGLPRRRVMGSGTVLDTARFRHMLSEHCGVDVRNVHAYILGEHGDSEIAAWSMAHVAGLPMEEYCALCGECDDWKARREEIVERVRRSAYHIIDYKGATNFGIGMALTRIVGAILRNERSVLTVSTRLEGEYGLEGVCLSVPCLVSSRGVERVLERELSAEETEGLKRSADILRENYESVQKG